MRRPSAVLSVEPIIAFSTSVSKEPKTNGYRPKPGESSHAQLWRNYTGSPDQNCKKLGLIAKRLKEKRERADYEDMYPRLVDEIPGMLTDAQDFTAGLGALPIRFPNPAHVRQ